MTVDGFFDTPLSIEAKNVAQNSFQKNTFPPAKAAISNQKRALFVPSILTTACGWGNYKFFNLRASIFKLLTIFFGGCQTIRDQSHPAKKSSPQVSGRCRPLHNLPAGRAGWRLLGYPRP